LTTARLRLKTKVCNYIYIWLKQEQWLNFLWQIAAAWGQKKDIYQLSNDIKFKSSQEFMDDIWGHWAFIVGALIITVFHS
jgi:hypothetical protein